MRYNGTLTQKPGTKVNAMLKPENRVENVGRALCEAAGGKLVGAWLCFGEHDAVLIADMPDAESWSAVALAVTAGGAIGSGKPRCS